VEYAKRLLEGSALPIERIATEAGLGSLQALRHHFQQQLGISPRQYREMFMR
jgi:AraC family transcriptional activator FtrA